MRTEKDIKDSLKDLPDDLKEAYDEIYNRILKQKRSAPRIALNAFRWIQSSYTPLQSETLLDAISVEVGEQFSREHKIQANDLLHACQNLIILDESLNVFRFAHLSVHEYLETRLPKVHSHIEITKVCLSLLSSSSEWDSYDRTLKAMSYNYDHLHLLLYSAVFWPWHFSRCEDTNGFQILLGLRNTFILGNNYQEWLKYHRAVVESRHSTSDLYWRRIRAFQEQKGDDPLFSVGVFGLSRTFKAVFDLRSNVEKACTDQLLVQACVFGYLEIARQLVDNGADVSVADKYGRTPLHFALKNGHLVVVRLLMESGADFSIADKYGQAPLHFASANGHELVVRLLIDNGADISVADQDGWTPLHTASMNGYEAVVRLLIDSGADVSAANPAGWPPLLLASVNGYEAVVRLLIDNGANVSVANEDGRAPLHIASSHGHEAVIRLLIDKGADVSAADKEGRTPLYFALQNKHETIAKLLQWQYHLLISTVNSTLRTCA